MVALLTSALSASPSMVMRRGPWVVRRAAAAFKILARDAALRGLPEDFVGIAVRAMALNLAESTKETIRPVSHVGSSQGGFVMRVAILGTGKMGGAMARRLNDAGHELTLWNRTRERAELLGVGKVVDTPAEAARSSEIVISMLTDADAVRMAYLGKGGAASAAQNQVFVEM